MGPGPARGRAAKPLSWGVRRWAMVLQDPALEAIWRDVQMSLRVCSRVTPLTTGVAHFHVRLEGQHTCNGAVVFAPGRLLSWWSTSRPEEFEVQQQRILLKLSLNDWHTVAANCGTIRLVQAASTLEQNTVLIDATDVATTVIGDAVINSDTLTIAFVYHPQASAHEINISFGS